MGLFNTTCPRGNTLTLELNNSTLDPHEIGWIIAGVTAFVATMISAFTVTMHARNYYRPLEQRQILRILLMPAVYAIISFFSYYFFRAYTYYSLALVVYESIVIAAFLMLLLQYIGDSTAEQKQVLMGKDKRKMIIPFCCIRYRPSKPYFIHALKWSVLQYSFVRPAISIAGVITEYYEVLCPTAYSVHFAALYLDSIDFSSISVALFGLIIFYSVVKDLLKGKSPLIKFLSIKFIVMVVFYQGFVFGILQDYGVIKATEYWTATNVKDGLQALCICCEMVIFSIVFLFAFNWKEYSALKPTGASSTSVFWSILNSLNYSDFFIEAWNGIVFLFRFMLGRPDTRSSTRKQSGFDIDVFEKGSFDQEQREEQEEMNQIGKKRVVTLNTNPIIRESRYSTNEDILSSYGQESAKVPSKSTFDSRELLRDQNEVEGYSSYRPDSRNSEVGEINFGHAT